MVSNIYAGYGDPIETYLGKGELDRIRILITHKGHAVAAGPKIIFLGQLV
ncbi:MAG: hypothetical protein ACETWM_02025 [Candidatus Lokiarchaeia archaeon]